ncbi:MAG: HAD-IA family hydrolase [Gemmatimonadales bacterium]|nr:HAD-IA family hydrolase [Gemmatimonadales bacterium]
MIRTTTVLFDLDGTLLDSIQLIIDSYHHSLATHGLPARSDAEWLAGIGTPLRVQFRDWAHDPALFDALVATYREYNISNHDARCCGYPGAVEMVQAIRNRGLRTGLVTSKQRAGAERGLRLLGLDAAMDVLVGADDVVNPKPHPEPLIKAADHLAVDPRSAIYVGDSVHDMESGRAAGMRTAAALWGPFSQSDLTRTQPDYWLETPADLITLLQRETA